MVLGLRSWTLFLVHWIELTKFLSFKQLYVKEPLVRALCLQQQYNRFQKVEVSPPSFYPPYEKPKKSTDLVRTSLSRYSISVLSLHIGLFSPGYSACINGVYTHGQTFDIILLLGEQQGKYTIRITLKGRKSQKNHLKIYLQALIWEVRHHMRENKPAIFTSNLRMKNDFHMYHYRACINLKKSFLQLNSSNVFILTDFLLGRKIHLSSILQKKI